MRAKKVMGEIEKRVLLDRISELLYMELHPSNTLEEMEKEEDAILT